MASGGGGPGASASAPPHQANKPWSQVVSGESNARVFGNDIINTKENFERLKKMDHLRFKPDAELRSRIYDRMQTVLYGKFLGKALPLTQVRMALSNMWKDYGKFTISDLPNGYYYIRCHSSEMTGRVMWEGPWTIGGMVLQLMPWRANFQPAFERLETAAVWVQFHHLPMDYWEIDTLESLGSLLGQVLKIDDHTQQVDAETTEIGRAKFARLCIELDLSVPLRSGIWVGDEGDETLVALLYEKIPSFCFRCGIVGHVVSSCTQAPCSHRETEQDGARTGKGPQAMNLDGETGEPSRMRSRNQEENEELKHGWVTAGYSRSSRGRGCWSPQNTTRTEGQLKTGTWQGEQTVHRQNVGGRGTRGGRGGSTSDRGGIIQSRGRYEVLSLDKTTVEDWPPIQNPNRGRDINQRPIDKGKGILLPTSGKDCGTVESAAAGVRGREPLAIMPASSEEETGMDDVLMAGLITSRDGNDRVDNSDHDKLQDQGTTREEHARLVEQDGLDLIMEESKSGNDQDVEIFEDNLPLIQVQKEAKLEAIARRGDLQTTPKQKKGRTGNLNKDP